MDSRNITFRDNKVWNQIFGNCMEIGFELWNARVQDIVYEYNVCLHQSGSIMSMHNGGRAAITNVTYSNIVAHGLAHSSPSHDVYHGLKILDLQITYGQYQASEPKRFRNVRGSIANVKYQNIYYHTNGLSYLRSRLVGNSSVFGVQDITFDKVLIDGSLARSLSDINASTNSFVSGVTFDSIEVV